VNLIPAKRTLGLFSIALGVTAVAAPERLSRWLGLQTDPEAMSAFGAREIASGSGLLSPVKPGPWFWMRAVGDVVDLFALRTALRPTNPRRRLAAGLALALVAIAVLDVALAAQASLNRGDDARAAV